MVPTKNKEEFLNRYGKLWYLREFDYLPQELTYYDKNLTKDFFICVNKRLFEIFDNKEDAYEASYQVRKLRGIKPYTFDENIMKKHFNEITL